MNAKFTEVTIKAMVKSYKNRFFKTEWLEGKFKILIMAENVINKHIWQIWWRQTLDNMAKYKIYS